MPQYQCHSAVWKLESGGQVLDLDTAVKDGILGSVSGGDCVSELEKEVDLRKMMEEVEDEEVPRVFICPISLEPMRDPVTLCTGQTYERANIVRWVSMGHRTCPTTMQELWDDGLTPNRTLRHLVHAWFAQRHLRFKKRTEDVQGRAAHLLTSTLRTNKGQARLHAIQELRRLVVAHPSVHNTLAADLPGVAFLASLLGPLTSHAVGSETVAILVHLPLHSDSKAALMHPAKVSLVVDMLIEGTLDTKINCTRFIASLMDDNNFRPELVSSLSLLVGLLRLIKDKRFPDGVSAGLSLLKSICHSNKQARGLALTVGTVPILVELLQPPGLNPDGVEAVLHVLEDLSGSQEGLAALKECPDAIPIMVKLLMRMSESVTQLALSILWAVCKLSPEECAAAAVEAGLAAKLLLVIQSGCGTVLKQRSSELLKLCSLNYTASLFISKCKLTRTIQ